MRWTLLVGWLLAAMLAGPGDVSALDLGDFDLSDSALEELTLQRAPTSALVAALAFANEPAVRGILVGGPEASGSDRALPRAALLGRLAKPRRGERPPRAALVGRLVTSGDSESVQRGSPASPGAPEAEPSASQRPATDPLEEAGTGRPDAGAGTIRYRVKSRLAPLRAGSELAGHLYRWAVLDGRPRQLGVGTVELARLVSGRVRMEVPDSSDPGVPLTLSPDPESPEAERLLLRNSRERVRGRIPGPHLRQFQRSRDTLLSTRSGELTGLTPADCTLSLSDLEPIDAFEEEPPGRRHESGDVQILFIRASNEPAEPEFRELEPEDELLATCIYLDYEGGLGDEMAFWKRWSHDQPLYLFLSKEAGSAGAYQTSRLPARPGPSRANRRFTIPLLSGPVELQEPHVLIVMGDEYVSGHSEEQVLSTLKHELGHAIHTVCVDPTFDGYDMTFGSHTLVLRTSAQTAFVEGFAEYSAARFADTRREFDPEAQFDRIEKRNNTQAYSNLLWFFWNRIVSEEAVSTRIPESELDGLRSEALAFTWDPRLPVPSPDQFRAKVVGLLSAAGSPPLGNREAEGTVRRVERSHPDAMANLRDEHLSARERAGLGALASEVARQGSAGEASTASYSEALARLRRAAYRSPTDLMMNEGCVAKILLQLDRHFAEKGIDFYAKILEAMTKAPPYGEAEEASAGEAERPQYPRNIKELLAVLEQDPQLAGQLTPIVTATTRGIVKAEHLVLAATAETDPLVQARPGRAEPESGRPEASPSDEPGLSSPQKATGFRRTRPAGQRRPGYEDVRTR